MIMKSGRQFSWDSRGIAPPASEALEEQYCAAMKQLMTHAYPETVGEIKAQNIQEFVKEVYSQFQQNQRVVNVYKEVEVLKKHMPATQTADQPLQRNIDETLVRQNIRCVENNRRAKEQRWKTAYQRYQSIQSFKQHKRLQKRDNEQKKEQVVDQNKKKVEQFIKKMNVQSTVKQRNAADRRQRLAKAKVEKAKQVVNEAAKKGEYAQTIKQLKGKFIVGMSMGRRTARAPKRVQSSQEKQLQQEAQTLRQQWHDLLQEESELQQWRRRLLEQADEYQVRGLVARFAQERAQFRRKSEALKGRLQLVALHIA